MKPAMTEGMTPEEIVAFSKTRPEPVWHWGSRLGICQFEIETLAKELSVELLWGEPILPGDLYIAQRNTGPKFLTCARLGDAWVGAKEPAYTFDFSECVKVREIK